MQEVAKKQVRLQNKSASTTCKDVAEVAGVAHSTVSRAINNTGYVSPKTRKLVLEAAKKIGYRPSSAARSLVSQKHETIGLVTESETDESSYRASFLIGASTRLGEIGYRMAVGIAPSNGKTQDVLELPILERRCLDGLILDIHRLSGDYTALIKEIALPCVLVNPPSPVSFNAVLPDDITVANQATAHLIENGHTKIGYMPRLASCTHGSQFDRMKGYSQALSQHSLSLIQNWDVPLGRGDNEVGIEDQHYLPDIKARLKFYLQKHDCTAIVAYDSRMAARTLVAAYEMGLKVPDDFSLIACDYESSLQRHICDVTAFKIDRGEIARCAVEMVMQMVEKGLDRINTIYVKGKFVQGNSVVVL